MTIIERREILVDGTWLKKTLCYNFSEVKKLEDLKNKIASELKIKISDFSFVNVNPEKAFKIKESLKIKLNYLPSDISLHLKYLPTERTILIKNGAKKKFEEIIKCIKDEGIFYSKKCLDEGINFDFSCIEINQKVKSLCVNVVKKGKDVINIKFYNYIMSFTNYDNILAAQNQIKDALIYKKAAESSNVLITEGSTNKKLDVKSFLKPKIDYKVQCVNNFTLSTEKKYHMKLPQPYSTTVLDVKKSIMAMVIHHEVSPDQIILKKDGKEIKDDNKPLIEIGRNIDLVINNDMPEQPMIKINFVFEERSEEKFDSFTESFPKNLLICDLANIIRDMFKVKIDKKIDIKYEDRNLKCKNTVDVKMSLDDILDEMKNEDQNGEVHYFLYINIKSEKRSLKKVKAPKITYLHESEEPIPKQTAKSTKSQQPPKQQPPAKQQPQTKSQNAAKSQQSSKAQQPVKSQSSSKAENSAPKKVDYIFIYDGNEEEIQCQTNSLLKDNEKQIRKAFDIDDKLELEFKIESNDHNEIEADVNSPMEKFECEIPIKVYIHGKPNTYIFKANTSDDLCQVELESGATVRDLKRAIAKQNKVNNLAKIKIIFAGKDLLDNIVLDDLNVNNIILFVYIQSIEDILLLSAKAFHIDDDDNDEYDFGEDDDDNDC